MHRFNLAYHGIPPYPPSGAAWLVSACSDATLDSGRFEIGWKFGCNMVPGLFISGSDTGVGKTRVAARIAAKLTAQGLRVGVYKPVASGCRLVDGQLVSDDALELAAAAGCLDRLEQVCPQRFAAPLAPHLAAAAEGKQIDAGLLRRGAWAWQNECDILLVEGAGGLMSPVAAEEFVADLAYDLGFPVVVVVRNALGAINQTLQTLIAAAAFRGGLDVAGVVLNHTTVPGDDASLATNLVEVQKWCRAYFSESGAGGARAGEEDGPFPYREVPCLELRWQAVDFSASVDWRTMARRPTRSTINKSNQVEVKTAS